MLQPQATRPSPTKPGVAGHTSSRVAIAGFHGRGGVKRPWQFVFAAGVTLLVANNIASATEWKPDEADSLITQSGVFSVPIRWKPLKTEPSTANQDGNWHELKSTPNHARPKAVIWKPIKPSVAADIEKIEEEAPMILPMRRSRSNH